jgi:hypothetical protein
MDDRGILRGRSAKESVEVVTVVRFFPSRTELRRSCTVPRTVSMHPAHIILQLGFSFKMKPGQSQAVEQFKSSLKTVGLTRSTINKGASYAGLDGADLDGVCRTAQPCDGHGWPDPWYLAEHCIFVYHDRILLAAWLTLCKKCRRRVRKGSSSAVCTASGRAL